MKKRTFPLPRGSILLCTVRKENDPNIYDCQTTKDGKIGTYADMAFVNDRRGAPLVSSALITKRNVDAEHTVVVTFARDVVCKESEYPIYIDIVKRFFRLTCEPSA